MEGLSIYHGVATLIPGLCLILVAAIAFLPSTTLNTIIAGVTSLEDIAVLLPLTALGSYLVGIVAWDLAYFSAAFSLFPFYWLRRDGLDFRYWQRLRNANRILEAAGSPARYEYTKQHYRRFLIDLVHVTETHNEYLGHRVSAEWERLGLYCAVAFSCKLALLLVGGGVAAGRVFGYETLIGHSSVLGPAIACIVLLGLAAPLAFSRRNRYLGRDVGLGIADEARQTQDDDNECLIVVDFDGVLADTNSEKAELVKKRFGKVVDPRQCVRSFCVPHILDEQQYESLGEVVYSASRTMGTEPIARATEAVVMLHAAGWKVIVLTVRQEERLAAARRWLLRRFGPLAPSIHSSAGFPQSKAELAAEAGALAIVDDDPRHLVAATDMTPMRFLFSPPEEAKTPEGVIVVQGWGELLEHLSELKPCSSAVTKEGI